MFERLLNPRSIAVVGASRNPEKIGNVVIRNLIKSGYKGKIYPVNPKCDEIFGHKCYPDVKSIPDEIDLAVIVLPAKFVLPVLKDCVDKGIRFVIPIAGGFGETGEEGKKAEEEMRKMIQGKITRIIGPNTVGIYIPRYGVNTALTAPEKTDFPPDGDIAFISQSGALGLLTMDEMSKFSVGFGAFINLGNRVDLNENELMEFFAEDENIKSIVMYIETFANAREFVEKAREISKKKPIIVLKAGRTSSGAKAAASHTGALASNDRIVDGALKQCGAIRAYDEEEMIDYARALAYQKPLFGDNIAIVTTAGGVGVVTADYVEEFGLRVAQLSEETKRKIKEDILPFASANNPIDMTASASDDHYDSVLEVLNEDEGVDGIIVYALFQTPLVTEKVVDVIEKWAKKKPTVVGVIGGSKVEKYIKEFEKRKIPVYPSIIRCVKSMVALRKRGKYLEKVKKKSNPSEIVGIEQ